MRSAEGADADKASAESAKTAFTKAMAELEALSGVASNAAANAKKIVSRGSALKARAA
jgi:hypothetical protein